MRINLYKALWMKPAQRLSGLSKQGFETLLDTRNKLAHLGLPVTACLLLAFGSAKRAQHRMRTQLGQIDFPDLNFTD